MRKITDHSNPLFAATFARTRMFAEWPKPAIDRLIGASIIEVFASGEMISVTGDPASGLWLIAEGTVESSRSWASGRKIVFDYLQAGQVSGIMPVVDGQPTIFDLVALIDTKIVFVPRQPFLGIVQEHPELWGGVAAMLSRRNRLDYERIQLEAMNSIRCKIAKFLLYLGRGLDGAKPAELVSISQDDLAGMMGASRQSINKHLSAMVKSGAVARRYRGIVILDYGKLAMIASEEEPLSGDARTAIFERSKALHPATD